ncbi:MAG: hypothetical protein OXH83_08620 [Bryobacterales bacterium]|nr:hypothetical protein [Bryobacterales bacterium]
MRSRETAENPKTLIPEDQVQSAQNLQSPREIYRTDHQHTRAFR